MTQPQPYPGDLPPEQRIIEVPNFRVRLERQYRDVLDRPMRGYVNIRAWDDKSVDIDVPEGDLAVDLPRGRYRLLAVLADADGRPVYQSEVVTL